MAEKVNKIPTQNSVASVVAAHIKDTTDTINTIVNSAVNSTIKYSSETLDQLKTYSEVVNSLFNNNGAVITLIKAAETFQKFDGKKSSKESIKKGFETIKVMQTHIKDLLSNISELKDIPEINLTGVVDIIKDINTLRGSLDKEDKNLRPMWFRFWLLKREISKTIGFITDISKIKIENEIITSAKALTSNIKLIYKDISEFLGSFDSVTNKQIALFYIKWVAVKNVLNNIIDYFSNYDTKTINRINKIFDKDGLSMMFDSLSSITENISKNVQQFIKIKTLEKLIINGIESIANIAKSINEKFENIKTYKTTITTLEKIQDITDKLVTISKHIIILGLIAIPTLLASLLAISALAGIAVMIASILVLSKLVKLVEPKINNGFKSLASIITALLVIGAALIGFALLTPIFIKSISWGVLWFVLATLALSLAIWIAFKIIGKLSISSIPSILAFGLTVGILIATIMGAGLIIITAAKMTEYINESVGKITLMIVGMLALTAAMVALGIGIAALSPFIVSSMIGFGQILVIIGLIIGIGLAINYLATVEVKSVEAGEKTKEIILTVNKVREQLVDFGTKKEWKEDKKVLKQVRKVTNTLTKIADDLNILQSVTIDKDKIIANVTGIMKFTQTLEDLMNKLLFGGTIDDKENASNENFVTRNLTKLFHKRAAKSMRKELRQNKKVLNKVDKVIDKLVGIGEALISVGELKITGEFKKDIENNVEEIFTFIGDLDGKINSFLNIPAKNSEGKPLTGEEILDEKKIRNKEWRKNKKTFNKVEATIATIQSIGETFNLLKDFKFVTGDKNGLGGTKDIIIKNVGILLETAGAIGTEIENKKDSIKISIDETHSNNVMSLIDYVASLNTNLDLLAKIDTSKITTNADNYITAIDKVFERSNIKNDLSTLRNINSMISDFGSIKIKNRNIKTIEKYGEFVDKINTVDVTKLETSAKMFEQMSRFSTSIKGDFDKLAEALSDKLLPVLEELKTVMTSVPEKLDIGFQNTSASIAAVNSAPTKENLTAQLNRENPALTAAEIDDIVAKRMHEKAKADANSMSAKLDELMSLLKGFSGEHVIVQTV